MNCKTRSGGRGALAFYCRAAAAVFLLLLVCLSPLTKARAADADTRKLRVGYFRMPGYHDITPEGVRFGYGYDFLRLLAPYGNFEYEYVGHGKTWLEMMDMLERGEIDFLAPALPSASRRERFDFVENNIGYCHTIVVVRANDYGIVRGRYESYQGKRIGAIHGSVQEENLRRRLESHGVEYTAVEYGSSPDMQRALREREIDAYVDNDLSLYGADLLEADSFNDAPFYGMVTKGNKELLDRMNIALGRLSEDNPGWQNKLARARFDAKVASAPFSLTAEERRFVRNYNENHTLKILIDPDRAPYTYTDKGEFDGIFYDLLKIAMDKTGFKYEIIKTATTEEYYACMAAGIPDVIFDSPCNRFSAEQRGYNGTEIYYEGDYSLLKRRGVADVRTLAVEKGDVLIDPAYRVLNGDKKVIPINSLDGCVKAVRDGKVDGCYMYTYAAANYVADDFRNELEYTPVRGVFARFRIEVKQGTNPLVFSILNKFAVNVTPGNIQSLIIENTKNEPYEKMAFVRRNPGLVASLLLVLFLLAFIAFMSRLKQRQEEEQSQQLRRMNAALENQQADLVAAKEQAERSAQLIEALSRDYMSISILDMNTDELAIKKHEGYLPLGLDPINQQSDTYSEIMYAYIESRVHPDYREYMHAAHTLAKITAELADKEEYVGHYRIVVDSDIHYIQFKYVRLNENQVIIGYRGVDEMMAEELKGASLAAQQSRYRDALREAAEFAMSLDITDGFLRDEVYYKKGNEDNIFIPKSEVELPCHYDKLCQRCVEDADIDISDRKVAQLFSQAGLLSMYAAGTTTESIEYHCRKADKYFRVLVLLWEDVVKHHVMFAGYSYDITENRKAERIHQQELQNALAQAERANIAKTVFLNSMNHDIRTPMNAIIGFTNLAISHIADRERTLDHLGKIRNASEHLLALINDVLDMSRIESGKLNLQPIEVMLPELVGDIENMLRSDAQSSDLTLNVEVDVRDPAVWCDRLRVSRILMNCLGNSVKFTLAGGCVGLFLKQLDDADDGCGRYEFRVKDTGIGMSPEFLKHIFEPFEREETSTISGIQGTGLGMAICKSIVDMMGGTIRVESEKNVGTEFFITLQFPLAEIPASEPSVVLDGEEIDSLHGIKVLLVEDNELNREIATDILEEAGVIVSTAENGKIAVDTVSTSNEGEIDAILMDVQMPVMNGYDATRAIRKLAPEYQSQLPIIAMTANAFEEDKKNAFAAGMDGHVAKPVDVDILFDTLKRIINARKAGGGIPSLNPEYQGGEREFEEKISDSVNDGTDGANNDADDANDGADDGTKNTVDAPPKTD